MVWALSRLIKAIHNSLRLGLNSKYLSPFFSILIFVVTGCTHGVSPSHSSLIGSGAHINETAVQWTHCADENGTCSFGGTMRVRYGALGSYHTGTYTDSVSCSNATFGDPISGIGKSCDYSPVEVVSATPVWSHCADEYGYCAFSGTATVRFGAQGAYNTGTFTGGVACSNSVFGDPIAGVGKGCDIDTSTSSVPQTVWTNCTVETGHCSFTGTMQVRFGANGQYFTQVFTDGVDCNNSVFGDPAPGYFKSCDYAPVATTSPTPVPTPEATPVDLNLDLPNATISKSGSQQCMHLTSTDDYSKVESWTCWGAYNQRFTIAPQAGSNNYEISLAGSGKCLQTDYTSNPGSAIQFFFCYAGPTQLWRIQKRLDGKTQIVSSQNGLCLDAGDASNGTSYVQSTCASTDSQAFDLNAFVIPPAISSSAGASPYVPAGYRLVFGDDFEQAELDTSKWWTRYINGGTVELLDGTTNFLNGGQERFGENKNHVMTGSTMKLTAYGAASDWEHPSGMVRSKKTFKYGYFETRVKVPKAHGVFPAFWMVPDSTSTGGYGGWPPEMDFFEYINNADSPLSPYQIHSSFHSDLNQKTPWLSTDTNYTWNDPSPYYTLETRMDADFHVIGALWDTDDTLAVFIDGRQIFKHGFEWKHEDGTEPPFGHLLLDLAVGGWPGRPDTDWNLDPQALEVDYVRAYQKVGSEQNGVSFIGHDDCPADGGC